MGATVVFPEISREIVITIVVDCDISAVLVFEIEVYMYHDGLRIVVPVSPFGISDKQIFQWVYEYCSRMQCNVNNSKDMTIHGKKLHR